MHIGIDPIIIGPSLGSRPIPERRPISPFPFQNVPFLSFPSLPFQNPVSAPDNIAFPCRSTLGAAIQACMMWV